MMSRCAWCRIHVTNKLCFSLKHITLYNGLWFYVSVLSDKDSWLFRTCWDNWVVTARSLQPYLSCVYCRTLFVYVPFNPGKQITVGF